MPYHLLARQSGLYGDDDDHDNDGDNGEYWGDSTTAIAVKWAFVGAILLFFLLWFVGGYYHAQRRIKRGVPPLGYHRFLLPRHQRMQYMPRPQYTIYLQQHGYGEGYPMQTYPAPPPAYHAEHAPPPVYQPPEGGSKVNPHQDWASPPPGLPPGHNAGEESSNSMQNVPLNQTSTGHEDVAAELPPRSKKPGLMSKLNPFKARS